MIDTKLSPEMEKRKTELEAQFKEEFVALLKK
jgi:hypothetical protein